jgi:hypothetical protein
MESKTTSSRHDKVEDLEQHENILRSVSIQSQNLSAATLRLKFLWKAYQPKYWYWEVIETTRKLMLTAVLSVCDPGSPKQNLLGLLLSFGYIRLYSYYSPYDENNENVLAETGQMQILFTFFVIMALQQKMINESWNYGLGALLVIFNLSIFVLTIRYEILNYRIMAKENLEQMENTQKGKKEELEDDGEVEPEEAFSNKNTFVNVMHGEIELQEFPSLCTTR